MPPASLRYPIGPFAYSGFASEEQRQARIGEIAALPELLRAAVAGLSEEQWEAPYRPGGWTVRQLVHHLPDSHLNAYCRFKLALTEDEPVIKPYDEAAWAELADTRDTPPAVSLVLLEALHQRWAALLRGMAAEDFRRTLLRPEQNRALSLDELLALYAWHGRHHLRHITALAEQPGWAASQEV